MKWTEVVEGRTRLIVPNESITQREPPTVPVFFNPAAALNRDITVAVTSATGGRTFCDALCGVGARGIRVAREVKRSMFVTLVDFNGSALRAARRNAKINNVEKRCETVKCETNSFLHSRFRRYEKFDYVDVDPFGTPVPYIQAALSATADSGVVSFTATDTAVLCGVHPRVARRRYLAEPLNNHFCHETALRILFNACRKLAGQLDIGLEPVAAHSTRHYLRIFCRVKVGATVAESLSELEGYVGWCASCGEHRAARSTEIYCSSCGSKMRWAGPLWIGELSDREVVEKAFAFATTRSMMKAARRLRLLLDSRGLPPYGYRVEEACSRAGVATVPFEAVLDGLRSVGYRAEIQPFETGGIKTDAQYSSFLGVVRKAALP